jgi:hypothetical protein
LPGLRQRIARWAARRNEEPECKSGFLSADPGASEIFVPEPREEMARKYQSEEVPFLQSAYKLEMATPYFELRAPTPYKLSARS